MENIFYHNSLDSPITLNITTVQIKETGSTGLFKDYNFTEEQKNYLSRYLQPERNSRINSELSKNQIWNVKWKSQIDSSAIPWYLLIKNDRLIIQNESGWELFDTGGKFISKGIRAEGEIAVSQSSDDFFVNDFSGYIQNIEMSSGKRKYYVYPYLGKGFNRSVVYTNVNKFIDLGFELPVMTHNSPIKPPEFTVLEEIKINNPVVTDEDGVIEPPVASKNLLVKEGKILTALHDSTIVIAVTNHLYFMNNDLEITKELTGKFNPLEMSLDEDMRIYLLANTEDENKIKTEIWLIDAEGNLIYKKEIPPFESNNLIPPAIGYDHTAYIAYDDKIIAVSVSGEILWQNYIQKPLAGIAVIKNFLFISEGNLLTAFNRDGERRFFYKFDDDLSTAPIFVNNQIFVATGKYLFCLAP